MSTNKKGDELNTPTHVSSSDILIGVTSPDTPSAETVGVPISVLASSLGYNLTRALIPSVIVTQSTFMVTGFSAVCDGGEKAMYTLGTSSDPMAIQDAAGTWFKLVTGSTVNVKWFDAKGDNSTDDGVAIDAAITALVSPFGLLKLQFPKGIYSTSHNHVMPLNTNSMVFEGDGQFASILSRRNSATGDLLTINSSYSGIQNMQLDGRVVSTGGDGLVLNAGFTYAKNCIISNHKGNGITVGKAAGSVNFIVENLTLRYNRAYGIQVLSGGNTDGSWSNVNVGNSGLTGIKIQDNGQLLNNVHVWGSGLESATDRDGFFLATSHNVLTGCESEGNMGRGVYIGNTSVKGNLLIGCDVWGNCGPGVYGFASTDHVISGCNIRDNGVYNTTTSTSVQLSGITNDSGTNWAITGNTIYDTALAIPAGSYNYTPSFPYPGRASSHQSQTYGYGEAGTADSNMISGNTMIASKAQTGLAYLVLGTNNVFGKNNFGTMAAPVVASAATITLPATMDLVSISGTTNITSITAGAVARRVTLKFTNAAPGTVVKGSNLILKRDYTPIQNGILDIISDGTNWIEISRLNSTDSTLPDVQAFPTSGTWTKPLNATLVDVYLLGGASGGGSGRRGASLSICSGGSGGGGGAYSFSTFKASDLSSTESVTTGTGGAGGAAVTTDDTNGNPGVAGGASIFKSTTWLRTQASAGGLGGTASGQSGGAGGFGSNNGGAGGAASATGGAGSNGSSVSGAGSGGAGGGGITSVAAASNGGAGGGPGSNSGANGTAGTSGGNGGDGTTPSSSISLIAGTGGGGGGASATTIGGGGGAGGIGSGGGGGGASLNGSNSGAGGTGGNGFALVVSR